jgi:hypothetical protein
LIIRERDSHLLINLWGLSALPVYLWLEAGCTLELGVQRVGDDQNKTLTKDAGRLLGRSWYNTMYGRAPNRL